MDLNATIKCYNKLLGEITSSKYGSNPRAASRLYECLLFILGNDGNDCNDIDIVQRLSDGFINRFTKLSIKYTRKSKVKQSFRDMFMMGYREYTVRLKNLSESIHYLEGYMDHSLNTLLEDIYMRKVFDVEEVSLKAFREACSEYISGQKDCKSDLLIIYKAICGHIKFNMNKEGFWAKPQVKEFFEMGYSCLRQWISDNGSNDFIILYNAYQNLLELTQITNQNHSSSNGFEALFDSDYQRLMDSLTNITLNADIINTIIEVPDAERSQKIKLLVKYFNEARPIKYNGDFNHLLTSIALNDIVTYKPDLKPISSCIVSETLRNQFKRDLNDPDDFHFKLLEYMDRSFQQDFKTRKNIGNTNKIGKRSLWVESMVSLIVNYTPNRSLFLKRFLRKGVFRQMLMLTDKFPSFFLDKNSLEGSIINNLKCLIPQDMFYINQLLETGIDSLQEVIDLGQTKVNQIFINERLATELSLNIDRKDDPPWPSDALTKYWQKTKLNFKHEGKNLFGVFSLHIMSVSTPIILPNGRKLTLLCDPMIASILCEFNSDTTITKNELKAIFDKFDISAPLQKLLKYSILRLSGNILAVNTSFSPSRSVAASGILRLS